MMKMKRASQKVSLVIHAADDYTAPQNFSHRYQSLDGFTARLVPGPDFPPGESAAYFQQLSRSGAVYFTNIKPGAYRLLMSAPLFVSRQEDIVITDSQVTEVSVRMKPGYNYKFYGETSLVRGRVVDALTMRPLAGVSVTPSPRGETSFTDEHGRFLVYFKEPIAAGGETISLNFTHNGYTGQKLSVSILPMDRKTLEMLKLSRA